MGGRVAVSSTVDVGSVFEVWLRGTGAAAVPDHAR
jgi:hypothetical protein